MGEMVQIFKSEIESWQCQNVAEQAWQHHSPLPQEGVQQVYQMDVDPLHRCTVYNIYCKKLRMSFVKSQ